MSNLFRAMNGNVTTTTNGMGAYQDTSNPCVDLFFNLGASRGKFKQLAPIISKAYAFDQDATIRILLHGRDIREGAGERQTFKDAMTMLINSGQMDFDTADRVIQRIPELGRYDDLLAFIDTDLEGVAFNIIAEALDAGDGLCAKWMPREKNNPKAARKLAGYLSISERQYRRLLVRLTNVVETKMCDNKWTEIEYGKVPSKASAMYQKAFGRHDQEGYGKYIESLKRGEAKINAGAVYPHDVVKSVIYGNNEVANEQWKALPNYLANDNSNTLVVADTSGSMTCPAGSPKSVVRCLDVCVSLAIYLSERNTGIFKDQFITFSSKPALQTLRGRLSDKVFQLRNAHWEMNTNIEAVFKLILSSALKSNIPAKDMPTRIIILSDMQFDQCVSHKDAKAIEMIDGMYAEAGYIRPQVVFWNLHAYDNAPVEFDKANTALVSGFSPAIMKGVLASSMDDFTPVNIMNKTIFVERYNY